MIKMSLIALMALYLLPLVISAAYNSLNGVKWDPTSRFYLVTAAEVEVK